MLKEANLEMTFFMETKLQSSIMERCRKSWGFVYRIEASSNGTMGDLSLRWNQGLKILLRNFLMHHIDVTVKDEREDH